MEFVTLSCPSCGSRLQITNDLERLACSYCGNEHVVRRAGGVVALTPVAEDIRQVRVGVDKTASELAIKRLAIEIPQLEQTLVQKKQEMLGLDDMVRRTLHEMRGVSFWRDLPPISDLARTLETEELLKLRQSLQDAVEIFSQKGRLEKRLLGFERKTRQLDLIQEILDIEKTLSRKQAELRKHQQIVSG